MGRDKACIPIGGIPMLRRVYDVAAQCTPNVFVVTPWPQRYQPLLPSSCGWIVEQPPVTLARPPIIKHPNLHHPKPQGPLVGFAYGLTYLTTHHQATPWILLLACDLPCLDPAALKNWAAHLPQVSSHALAALPHHANGWEPLCGFYRVSCLDRLIQFIDQSGRSFQRWLWTEQIEALPTHTVDNVSLNRMMTNCNTPADLDHLLSP